MKTKNKLTSDLLNKIKAAADTSLAANQDDKLSLYQRVMATREFARLATPTNIRAMVDYIEELQAQILSWEESSNWDCAHTCDDWDD
jgi:hypothetical protein